MTDTWTPWTVLEDGTRERLVPGVYSSLVQIYDTPPCVVIHQPAHSLEESAEMREAAAELLRFAEVIDRSPAAP